MGGWRKKLIAFTAASALVCAHGSALANTRASEGSAAFIPVSATTIGAFPHSAWLIPQEDEPVALWQWAVGGIVTFAALSVFFSNDPDSRSNRPIHRSNGAN